MKPISLRAKVLKRAAGLMRERGDELARYVTVEMGKLWNESKGEVALSADILEYYADHGSQISDIAVDIAGDDVRALNGLGLRVCWRPALAVPAFQLREIMYLNEVRELHFHESDAGVATFSSRRTVRSQIMMLTREATRLCGVIQQFP
jgi:hypothetical protein